MINESNSDYILPDSIRLDRDKTPILDRTLYVSGELSHIVLGGVNMDSVKYAVRGLNGERVPHDKSCSHRKSTTRLDTEPYFELEYKRHFFDIQVHKIGGVALFSVSKIDQPKMTLKSLGCPS